MKIDEVEKFSSEPQCQLVLSQLLSVPANFRPITIQVYAPDSYEVTTDKDLSRTSLSPLLLEESFLRYLESVKILKILSSDVDAITGYFVLEIIMQITDYNKLSEIALSFEKALVDEPYGESKQIKLLADMIKDKFSQLENREVSIRTENLRMYDNKHIYFYKSLRTLANEGYIEILAFNINFLVADDSQYGFYAKVRILDKWFLEWVSQYFLANDFLQFDESNGILQVENKKYDFGLPGTIEAKLMSLLTRSVNERVTHKELAAVTWEIDDPEVLERLYAENKKTFVNQKNKVRILDLKKKLRALGLDDTIKIVANNGYILEYKPSKGNSDALISTLAEKMQPKDIPF